MKNIVFFMLIMSALTWAAQSPDDYPVNVHVSSSQWLTEPTSIGPAGVQRLSVIISGRKYELEALSPGSNISTRIGVPLLALGDYKAKLVKDEHKTTYESTQVYEILLPDNKTRRFTVVGQTE